MTSSKNVLLFRRRIEAAWEAARAQEPARGAVTSQQLDDIRAAIDAARAAHRDGVEDLRGLERMEVEGALATALARAAVAALAAGDDATAEQWLKDAEALSEEPDQREELAAARKAPERYRLLVHGRNRFAAGDEARARALWQELVDAGPDDVLGRAAAGELEAPRPYRGNQPELFRWNGIGLGFYGDRDAARDGSYVTTHCFSVFFVPLIPLAAYRVRVVDGGYQVLSKEPLSRFARLARVAVVVAAVLGLAGYATVSYLRDPDRLARQRFDAAITAKGDPEAALRRLDEALDGPDLARVDRERAERAGAAVVRHTAGFVPAPFTRDHVDHAARLVARYGALPERARGGVARDAVLTTLIGWADALQAPADADARLRLLRQALTIAERGDPARAASLTAQLTELRLAVAAARAADWPLDALAVLVEEPRTAATMARATEIIAGLVERPSLLDDAGPDLDAWLAVTAADDPLRKAVESQRTLAVAGRTQAEVEDVTTAQLAAMLAERPWDQAVAVRLAAEELHAGKPEAADSRLRGFGPPGLLTRDARFVLAQVAAARDQLDVADQLLSELVTSRLPRFLAASAALDEAARAVQERLAGQLDAGDVPDELRTKVEATSDEAARNELVRAWFADQMEADPAIAARRTTYLAYADLVPVAVAAGTIKLRRAQGLAGGERDAMLAEAERTFLAIRTQAEGQPAFHLALGEIYARLGKTAESDAELNALLARDEPALTSEVVQVYRNLGNRERAIQIATDAYAKAASPHREELASSLALMAVSDDEREGWLRKADQASPFIQTSLLEVEGRRLLRQGKREACARTFAAAATAHLNMRGNGSAGFNNAALAHQQRYVCSGDPDALRDAQAALEQAYRLSGEQPIVLSNLIDLLSFRGQLRVLGRRVDVRALRLDSGDVGYMLALLLDGSDRDEVLAELTADPELRRSRDLLRQYEVLAPSSLEPYSAQLAWAEDRRDPAAAAAVIARLDQAAVEADAARWSGRRRARSSVACLAKLAGDGDPLAETIRRSPAWPEVIALARSDRGRPGLDTVRLARMVDDPALAALAKAALDDRLLRLQYELYRRTASFSPEVSDGLALLDGR